MSSYPNLEGLGPQVQNVANQLQKAVNAMHEAAAATLAGSIIAASGRPHSVAEALELVRDIRFSLHPENSAGVYQKWKETAEERLRVPHT